jgi:hypothetical protein
MALSAGSTPTHAFALSDLRERPSLMAISGEDSALHDLRLYHPQPTSAP